MKTNFLLKTITPFCYGPLDGINPTDGLIPKKWARESLLRVQSQAVLPMLVHRNYSKDIASYGDTVNAHLPGRFSMKRKQSGQNVTTQEVSLVSVPVVLDGWGHVSFVIDDAHAALSFVDLEALYLAPAMDAIIDGLEYALLGRMYAFMGTQNAVGQLGAGMPFETLTAINERCDSLKMPTRYVTIGSKTKMEMLNNKDLVTADKIGDDGTRLRTASIGEVLGCQYVYSDKLISPAKNEVVSTASGAIDKTGGYPEGTKVLVVKTATVAAKVNTFITVAGDMTPQRITASTITSYTIEPGLVSPVADSAVVTAYRGFATNASKDIQAIDAVAVTSWASDAVAGQPVCVAGFYDGLLENAELTSVQPTIALQAPITSGDAVGVAPNGGYNLAFDPNAIALVTRPLPLPPKEVEAYVTSLNGIGMRVTKTYDGVAQGTRITLDFLYGTKMLNNQLGFMVYS
jgi:hypothetical protein